MEIILNDESVNQYGFRVLTSGIDLGAYRKNPIMLYDHTRRDGKNSEEIILPIGRFTNLRVENNQLIGTPEFDNEDEFAAKIERKFNKGILNAASIAFGYDAIEYSFDDTLMMPGQSGPTITACRLREVSITDIPANMNCVKLSDAERMITLNSKSSAEEIDNFFSNHKPTQSMKKVIAVLTASKLVSLPESASEELVAEGAQALVNQLSAQTQVIRDKDAEIARLKAEAETAKTNALKDRATTLVESALSAKKIEAAQKDKFVKLASASDEGYDSVKELLDSLKPYEPVHKKLSASADEFPAKPAELVKLHDQCAKGEKQWADFSEDQIKALWKTKHGKEISSSTLTALVGK